MVLQNIPCYFYLNMKETNANVRLFIYLIFVYIQLAASFSSK